MTKNFGVHLFHDLKNDPDELVNEVNNPKYLSLVEDLSKEIWNKVASSNDETMMHAEYFTIYF
ncbi:hypothetical protein AN396_03085 [Candidatus Epulonipiscium fishelsonii]|uniref:Uncharacterized protein n=1 Tax=Candidatus Epulonipiscium fishelsonii TaxID=77094 RepID=A0ACC8XF07_9FIRM|nr:hypothetical protein AN396_03085 [Epulopiscium sp. SCG-B11WGA-EpuloA1]